MAKIASMSFSIRVSSLITPLDCITQTEEPKKVFLTKSTKYDRNPIDFRLPVVIAEWELRSIFSNQWTENANLITDD